MALGEIPPWLRVSPPDFLAATAEGSSAGLNAAGIVNRNVLARQELAQRAQELSIRQQESEYALAERQRESDRESARTDALDALQAEYHRQQGAMAQQELAQKQQEIDLDTQAAMQKLAAQKQYQQLVASGMSPTDALMQTGPSMGLPMAGMLSTMQKSVPFRPSAPITTDGITMVNTGQGKWTQARAPIPTGVQALQTAQILDPEGNPIPNRYAYTGPTGRPTPLPAGRAEDTGMVNRQTRVLENRVKGLEKLQEGGTQEYLDLIAKTRAAFPKLSAKEVREKVDSNLQTAITQLNNQIDKLNGLNPDVEPAGGSPATPATTTPAATPSVIKLGSIKLVPATAALPTQPTNLYGQALPPPPAAAPVAAGYQPNPRLASAEAYRGAPSKPSRDDLIKQAKDALGWNVEWVPSMGKFYVSNLPDNLISDAHKTESELQDAIDSATEGRRYEP